MLKNYAIIVHGSDNLETRQADTEVLPGKNLTDFKFANTTNCHIKINNGTYIYIGSNQGFASSDGIVYSLKIQEDSVGFNWSGIEA